MLPRAGLPCENMGVVTLAQVASDMSSVTPELLCPEEVNQKLFSAVRPLHCDPTRIRLTRLKSPRGYSLSRGKRI